MCPHEQVFALQVADPGNTVIGSLLEVLGAQIHRFEAERYVIPEAPPHQVLAYLMDSRGLSQSSLAREVHIDQGTLSKLLTGVRAFSKAHAKALSGFFQVRRPNGTRFCALGQLRRVDPSEQLVILRTFKNGSHGHTLSLRFRATETILRGIDPG